MAKYVVRLVQNGEVRVLSADRATVAGNRMLAFHQGAEANYQKVAEFNCDSWVYYELVEEGTK